MVDKARFLGKTDKLTLINNKIYTVLSVEKGWYRIVCELDDDYLFPPELFEAIGEIDESSAEKRLMTYYLNKIANNMYYEDFEIERLIRYLNRNFATDNNLMFCEMLHKETITPDDINYIKKLMQI